MEFCLDCCGAIFEGVYYRGGSGIDWFEGGIVGVIELLLLVGLVESIS